MNETIALLLKDNNTDRLYKIDRDAIKTIESIITEHGDTKENDKYAGLIIIQLDIAGNIISIKGNCKPITDDDKEKIKDWFRYEEKYEYVNDMYRIDLRRYILMFNKHYYGNKTILVGYILNNNYETKLDLVETRQTMIMQGYL